MRSMRISVLIAGLSLLATAYAQAPAEAPAGSTGLCKDGTYWSGASKRGACSGHKGVQTWYGASGASGSTSGTAASANGSAASSKTATPGQTAPATPPATSTSPTPSPSGAPAKGGSSSYTPPATPAPGGGPGQVWVNKTSKVYHCPNDRWYGKTKNGAYMSEADAKAQGNRPDRGKACQ